VALADVAGIRPWANYAPYSVAKSCVIAYAKALANRLAPAVRVNCVAPGPILFPPSFDPEARRREISRTLLKRQGHPSQVSDAVLYLARSDYVTGAVVPVDGGRLLAA
jgi:NAD(P)-dependent dehydrogenase (short-subunit alcohol dehydrogenase family)